MRKLGTDSSDWLDIPARLYFDFHALITFGNVTAHAFNQLVDRFEDPDRDTRGYRTSFNAKQFTQCALSFVRKGDTLVVTLLDRLARSAADLHRIVRQLSGNGCSFRCLHQSSIDTTTSTGKLLLGVLASSAEFEAYIRRERQREGIERTKATGVYKCRKRTIDASQVRALRDQGLGGSETAEKLGIARASVYRALSR